MVVSKVFYFHPTLGKWSNLTNIFQMGWNHQLVYLYIKIPFRPSYHHHRITSMAHSKNLDISPDHHAYFLLLPKHLGGTNKKCHRQLLLQFAAQVLHRLELECEFLRSKALSFWVNWISDILHQSRLPRHGRFYRKGNALCGKNGGECPEYLVEKIHFQELIGCKLMFSQRHCFRQHSTKKIRVKSDWNLILYHVTKLDAVESIGFYWKATSMRHF